MQARPLSLAFFVALFPSLATATPQEPVGQPFDLRDVTGPLHGLVETGGRMTGHAPGYRIQFDEDGFTFHGAPARPGQAPATLRYVLTEIGRRGDNSTFSGTPNDRVRPEAMGEVAHYAHASFDETYEVREEGVEQSFLFHSLPAGSGDLVVRARIETNLEPSATGGDVAQMTFGGPGDTGITFGTVTGIDADGVRARGSMRYENGHLDLILPASFVEAAALPLVLDPLIGSQISFPTTVTSVAYDATNDTFYVVWRVPELDSCVFFFGGDANGQLVSSSGAKIGGVSAFNANGACSESARVANIASRDVFVVTWWEHPLIDQFVRVVDAATGAAGPLTNLPFDINGATWDLGGEVSDTADAAILVGHDALTNAIVGRKIQVDAAGAVTLGPLMTIAPNTPTPYTPVAISRSGGAVGRYLLVWNELIGSTWDLFGAVVDRDLDVLDAGPVIQSVADKLPHVDGDGSKWLVAYSEGNGGTVANTDSRTAGVFWNTSLGEAWVGPSRLLASGQFVGGVAWLGESYAVVHSGGGNAFLDAVDEFTGIPCESVQLANFSGPIAGQRSGDPDGGDLALVLTHSQGSFYRANDGITTDLGGACGSAKAAASCAVIGNQDFYLSVWDAPANVPCFLALSLATANIPCGPCTLVPSLGPLGITVFLGNTDSLGNADVLAPIPNEPLLAGAVMYEQWLFVNGGGCFNVELSNALKVELQ